MFETDQCFKIQPFLFSIANTKAMPRSVLNSSLLEPLVLWDANDKTLFGAGDSIWVSGSSVPGASVVETRKSRILPPEVSVDSSHSGVVLNPQAVTSVVSPLVHDNSTDGNLVFASRLGIASNEFFIYITERQCPIGCKIVGLRVNTAKRNFNQNAAVTPVGLQSALFSRTTSMTVPINNTSDTGRAKDYATEHYNSGSGSTNGTNAYIDLSNTVTRTVYNSTYDTFAVI